MARTSRWLVPFGVAAAVLGVGARLGAASGAGEVTIEVDGALNISAYCGGADTHFSEGGSLSFVPESARCDLEAPLSPQMPLRGQVVLDGAGTYRCDRKDMSLLCARR